MSPPDHRAAASTPDVGTLRILVEIAELGSISAAARTQDISQPSASKRMRVLERQLGLRLIDRRAAGSVLTEDGRIVANWSRAVVSSADALLAGSRALAARSAGQLRIAASQTIAECLVPTWISEYRRRHDTPVRTSVTNSRGVVSALRHRSADLGFVETPVLPSELDCWPIGRDRLAVVVAPGHPLARRKQPLSRAELGATRLVLREVGSGTRETFLRAMTGEMAAEPVELDSNAAVKVLVKAADCAGVLSELVVADDLQAGALVKVPVADVDLRRDLCAVWPRETALGAEARAFLYVAVTAARQIRA
jgi:molybdate transport repressor ModE-like protein